MLLEIVAHFGGESYEVVGWACAKLKAHQATN
jgi:hypothetical protein